MTAVIFLNLKSRRSVKQAAGETINLGADSERSAVLKSDAK